MRATIFAIIAVFVLSGCEGEGLSDREKGALGGSALGAGLGAIIGNQVGSTGAGIAIGAAAGGVAGGLIGNENQNSEDRISEQEEIMKRQDLELERQRRELEDLRRQQYHNDNLNQYQKDKGASPKNDFKY